MPQIIPFYFVNQISFTFITLFILLFIFSKFILPSLLEIQLIRIFISKL